MMNNQKVVISFEKITQQAPDVAYQQRYYAATSTWAGQRGTPEATRCVYLGQLRPAAGAQSPFVPPRGAQLYLFAHFHFDSCAELPRPHRHFGTCGWDRQHPRVGCGGTPPRPISSSGHGGCRGWTLRWGSSDKKAAHRAPSPTFLFQEELPTRLACTKLLPAESAELGGLRTNLMHFFNIFQSYENAIRQPGISFSFFFFLIKLLNKNILKTSGITVTPSHHR